VKKNLQSKNEIQNHKHEQKPFSLDAETLKLILDNCYDEIFVLDGEDRVIYVNSVSERHYGMRPTEVIGKSVEEMFELGYWYPPITPMVHREQRRITMEQTTFLGKKLITTVTPVFDDKGNIIYTVHNARDLTQLESLKQELHKTREELSERPNSEVSLINEAFSDIIAHSKKMKELIQYAEQIAHADANVLILGESGTGKGLFARHIHKHSKRTKGPFLSINCAAIPEDLLESELFGYASGAFTGAGKGGKKGLIELANGGTFFLDEIAELSPRLQAKMLQFIQERQYIPVGGTETKNADIRIIAATNSDMMAMINEGKFRLDLYYRLNVIEIEIPPLRERPEDLIPLIHFFITKFNKKNNVNREISKEALNEMFKYYWPGNVRELENLIERLVVTVLDTEIKPKNLPKFRSPKAELGAATGFMDLSHLTDQLSLEAALELVERQIITQSFAKQGSSRKVAQSLNISQSKASRLIRKYCPEGQDDEKV